MRYPKAETEHVRAILANILLRRQRTVSAINAVCATARCSPWLNQICEARHVGRNEPLHKCNP
jgi:hypothetical protein